MHGCETPRGTWENVGETRSVGKSGVMEHKSGNISVKRVKIVEKLLWRDYRNSPTLFRTVPSSTPCGLLFPKIGGSQPPPKSNVTDGQTDGRTDDSLWHNRALHSIGR